MKNTCLAICCLLLLSSSLFGQEITIKGFPTGIGGSVGDGIFNPHRAELKAMADTLNRYPLSHVLLTGSADAERYRSKHDAMNPGLALSRAHALRNYLIAQFSVDTAQIFSRTEEVHSKGPEFRYVRAKLNRDLADLDLRLIAIENAPPPEPPPPVKEIIRVQEVPMESPTQVKLHLGSGGATSPFGGLPIVTAAVSWDERLFLEVAMGHTFWNSSFTFDGSDLNTKRRMLGGQVIYYPSEKRTIGLVGGWVRVEEISRKFYKFVQLSEGPLFGLRWQPRDYFTATGAWNPSRHRITEIDVSEDKNGQFMGLIAFHVSFGGAK